MAGTTTGGVREFVRSVIRTVSYVLIFPVFVVGTAVFFLFAAARSCCVDRATASRVTRATVHHGARLLFYVLGKVGLVTLSGLAAEPRYRITTPCVVVANHPSMLDALFFLTIVPQGVCIMKPALSRLPLIGAFARAAGYIPYGEAPELLARACAALKEGTSIIIFPEGTRSPAGALGAFQRGAARLAVEAGVQLEVFGLSMDPVVLGRELPWWRPPHGKVTYRVTRLAALSPQVRAESSLDDIRKETIRLTEELEQLIRSWLL